jgi:hypothetical protein
MAIVPLPLITSLLYDLYSFHNIDYLPYTRL